MTAMELYQQERSGKKTENTRQQYFQQLLSALDQELRDDGYSTLLDAMLDKSRKTAHPTCFQLEISAFQECYRMLVFGKAMSDSTQYVPHWRTRSGPMSWAQMEKTQEKQVPLTDEVLRMLEVLQAVSRQLKSVVEDVSIAASPETAQSRQIEDLKRMLRMQDDALTEAQEKNAELQSQLDQLSQGLITRQVQRVIDKRTREAEAEVQGLYEKRRQAGEAAFEEVFRDELATQRGQLEEEYRRASALYHDAEENYGAIRRDLGRATEALMDSFSAQLNTWQRALFHADHLMLAQSYVGLYTTTHETLNQLILDLSATLSGAHPLCEKARQTRQAFLGQLIRLENAMRRLGLQVLRPGKDDPFDPDFHALAEVTGGAAPQPGARIERCEVPGVTAQTEEEGRQAVLVRAVVRLQG